MNNFAGVPISCSIEEGQAVISGIHSGYTISQVRAILGNPSYTSSAQSGQILTYSYFASGINVKFWNLGRSGQYTVCGIQTTKMGYYTPAGITVGMPADMLNQKYGTADSIYTEKSVAPKLSTDQQEKYNRFGKTVYTYNVSAALSLYFVVKNDKITEIGIDMSD